MNAAPHLVGYAATVGLVAPYVMARASWPHRSPAAAAAVWSALAVSFSLCVALLAVHVVTPAAHVGVLYSCQVALGMTPGVGSVGRWGLTALAAVAGVHVGVFAFHTLRADAARSKHRKILDVVGRRAPELQAVVLDHGATAAYCLPGRSPRIVVSRGAVERLTSAELGAVVEHERAHVAGRHHLILAATQCFATVFRGLPLARHLREQIPLLLEMTADDRAQRLYSPGVLAAALLEMATGQSAPRGAMSATGATAVVRLKRIVGPEPQARPALWGAAGAAIIVLMGLPVLFAC
ncbi:M56 family metallopeptidase [Streptomyces sp. NPDC060030]|uniref:M56 family metallopeptidase n=1 Tax=Streptomyces sp. NPDC060030 TaxID=3347042 RepID=UPI00368EAD30